MSHSSSFFSRLLFFLLVLISTINNNINAYDAFPSSIMLSTPASTRPHNNNYNKLVSKVCNQTSNYYFCINSLYSDSRTPEADGYTLAFISVGLAYSNASATRERISVLIKEGGGGGGSGYKARLQRCGQDYNKAVLALEVAYNDLNSETFYELADLANEAARAADDCQSAFKGVPSPPLGNRNKNLKGLCEICAVVAKLFTGSL